MRTSTKNIASSRDLTWNLWGALLIALVLSFMVAFAEASDAPGTPDFTGTWVVEKVELPERPAGGSDRAPGGGMQRPGVAAAGAPDVRVCAGRGTADRGATCSGPPRSRRGTRSA